MSIANLNGVRASEAGKINECNFLRIAARMLLVLFLATVPSSIFADETLDDLITEYKKTHGQIEKIKGDMNNYKPEDIEYFNLNYKLKRTQDTFFGLRDDIKLLGGDIAAIEQEIKGVIIVQPGKKPRVSLDGEEEEHGTPKVYAPWTIDLQKWPPNAHALPSEKFMKDLEDLEELPTDWAKTKKLYFQNLSVPDLESYLYDHIKNMYVRIEGKPWDEVLQARGAIGWHEEGKHLNDDLKKFSRAWSKDSFKKNMIKAVFEADAILKYSRKNFSTIERRKWSWLKSMGPIESVRREFEDAQKDLRNVLLQVDDEWVSQTTLDWKKRVDKFRDIIIHSERKMIWLLGTSDNKALDQLTEAVKYKNTELIEVQEKLMHAYIDRHWFVTTNNISQAIPPDVDPKGLLVGEDKIEEQRRIEIFTNAYIKYYPKIVEEIADTWDTIDRMGGKKGIFALGLRRAIDLKLFVPHLVEQKAEFYKETLGEVEYKKLRKRFKVLTSDPVFYQFLPFGREYRIFEVQRGMRAPKEQ